MRDIPNVTNSRPDKETVLAAGPGRGCRAGAGRGDRAGAGRVGQAVGRDWLGYACSGQHCVQPCGSGAESCTHCCTHCTSVQLWLGGGPRPRLGFTGLTGGAWLGWLGLATAVLPVWGQSRHCCPTVGPAPVSVTARPPPPPTTRGKKAAAGPGNTQPGPQEKLQIMWRRPRKPLQSNFLFPTYQSTEETTRSAIFSHTP